MRVSEEMRPFRWLDELFEVAHRCAESRRGVRWGEESHGEEQQQGRLCEIIH